MNGRIYDPLLGRFLSADLTVQDSSDLQSFNRYSYVRNRPLSFIDPTGFLDQAAVLQYFSLTDEGRAIIGDLQNGNVKVIEYTQFVERFEVTKMKATPPDGKLQPSGPPHEEKRIWNVDSSKSTNPELTARGTITTDGKAILIKQGMSTKDAVKRIRHEWEHVQQLRKEGSKAFGSTQIAASERAAHVAAEKFTDDTNKTITNMNEMHKRGEGPKLGLGKLPIDSDYRDKNGKVSETVATTTIQNDDARKATQTPENERTSIFSQDREVQTGSTTRSIGDVQGAEIKFNWEDFEKWKDKMSPEKK